MTTPWRRFHSLAALEPVVVVAVTVVAAFAFVGFFGTLGWLIPVDGGVALGGLVAGVATARRWSGWATAALSIAVLAVLVIAVCYPNRTLYGLPGPHAWRALGSGLTAGWARMLSVAVPADATGDMMVTPVVLAYAAGLSGVLLTLQTRWVTVLALPPLLLFLAGLAVSAPRPAPWMPLGGGVLMALLVMMVLRANRVAAADQEGIAAADADAVGIDLAARRWHSTLGRVAFGLPVALVVAGAAVIGAAGLPVSDGSDRADPRTLRQQDFRLSTALTPLVQVKPQLRGRAIELFRVKVDQHGGSYPVNRVRVAALDSFDGALWTQSRDFLVTGAVLPDPPREQRLSGSVQRVDLDVHVVRLPSALLPVFGQPAQVTGSDLAYAPETGTLVSTKNTVDNFSYRLQTEVLPQTGIGTASAPKDLSEYTRLPDAPTWLTDYADKVTRPWRTPWTQLLALEKDLRRKGYSLEARPGHSYGAIRRALLGQADEAGGYAEQYASAFAVLARAKGYASRVAVGYLLRPQKREGDRYRVDSTDSHAWPEVYLAGYGWVGFEPTDTGKATSPKVPREQSAPVLPNNANVEQPREPESADAPAGTETGSGVEAIAHGALVAVVVVVAAILLLVALILVAKHLRRQRRRHRGPPAQRIASAWQETVDRLRERGVRAPASATPLEVAKTCSVGPGATVARQVGHLEPLITAAVCAEEEPTEEVAQRAWALEADIRRALAGGTPLPLRIGALLDPRPLLPRRRRGLPVPVKARSPKRDASPDTDHVPAGAGARR